MWDSSTPTPVKNSQRVVPLRGPPWDRWETASGFQAWCCASLGLWLPSPVGVGAPLLTWAFSAAPRQTGLGQPFARSLSMACPRLEPSASSLGDGDAAGSILARSHVLVASSNKLMPSIQLRVSRRRTVLAVRRDCMSSAASPYRVERVGDITLAPQG